jgi:Lrp/AsnC family transcriptional regulator, regulator for asnA, asnC and gidA
MWKDGMGNETDVGFHSGNARLDRRSRPGQSGLGTRFEERSVPMAVSLDEIDRRIILLLQEDGRMSARDVSRRLGDIGDRAVRYRIDRLVRSGVISVIAVVDNERIGYPVLGDVIVEVPAAQVRDALAALADDELVCYLGADMATGTITLQIAARDEYELRAWVSALVKSLDGATLIESTVVRQVEKGSDHWLPPSGHARTHDPVDKQRPAARPAAPSKE